MRTARVTQGVGSRTPTFFCVARTRRPPPASIVRRLTRHGSAEEAILERVAADQLEAREQRGAPVDGVLLEDERGLDLILGARQLLVAHRLALSRSIWRAAPSRASPAVWPGMGVAQNQKRLGSSEK